jgi:hypothetical protein
VRKGDALCSVVLRRACGRKSALVGGWRCSNATFGLWRCSNATLLVVVHITISVAAVGVCVPCPSCLECAPHGPDRRYGFNPFPALICLKQIRVLRASLTALCRPLETAPVPPWVGYGYVGRMYDPGGHRLDAQRARFGWK